MSVGGDAVFRLHCEMPFLWTSRRTGAESFGTEWLTAPVRISYVPLGAMQSRVHTYGEGVYGIVLVHAGREFGAFTRHTLAGLRELVDNGEPPLFDLLAQTIPRNLMRTPETGLDRWREHKRERAVFMPEAETLEWARRRVADNLVHDGTNLFRAIVDPDRRTLSQRVASCGLWALAKGDGLNARDAGFARMAADLRRSAILARLDALPPHDLSAAAAAVREFAGMVGTRHRSKAVKDEMARIVASKDLAVAPPDIDLAAIGLPGP